MNPTLHSFTDAPWHGGLYSPGRCEIPRAAAALVKPFRSAPLWHWAIGNAPDRDHIWQAAFEAPLFYCLRYGRVYAISPRMEAVAAWLPDEFADMTPWRMLLSGTLLAGMRMGLAVGRRMQPLFKHLAADRSKHMAGRRYLYLLVIGVAPACQRQGLAGRLLRVLLAEAAAAHKPVYLETDTESNLGFYRHFGFRLLQRTILPESKLPIWEMLHEPSERTSTSLSGDCKPA